METSLTMMGGTYDWSNMPTNINSMYSQPAADTLAYRAAIGKLTYDVGVAVGMPYRTGISGAQMRALATVMVDVFGYRGKGTTPMLTMSEGAVFKPNGTGYFTVTESLSGTMMIDMSGLDLESTYNKIPLVKVGSAEMRSSVSVDFVSGTKPKGWALVKTADGLGYDLARTGFSIIVR